MLLNKEVKCGHDKYFGHKLLLPFGAGKISSISSPAQSLINYDVPCFSEAMAAWRWKLACPNTVPPDTFIFPKPVEGATLQSSRYRPIFLTSLLPTDAELVRL